MADQLTATEQLIQQLRKPQQDKTQDVIRALSAFASPETQKQVLATMPKDSALSQEKQRLAAASKLEMAISKAKNTENVKNQDYKAIENMGSIVSGNNARKGKMIFKGRDRLKTSNVMLDMVEKFKRGELTFDDPSNTQYAAAFAKMMGTASGIEIVKNFKYDSVEGFWNDIMAYASGDPRTTVTPEQFKEIEIMSLDMAKNEQESVNNAVARELNNYLPRLKRNPELFQRFIQQYQDEAGEVTYNMETDMFEPVLTRDTSVLYGGKSIQPGKAFGGKNKVNSSSSASESKPSREELLKQEMKRRGII